MPHGMDCGTIVFGGRPRGPFGIGCQAWLGGGGDGIVE